MSDESLIRPITSRGDFQQAVRDLIEKAADAGAAELVFVDADFDAWPLGERGVVEALGRWASARCRLTLVAGSFDVLFRQAPRFLEWRRPWSHVVSCRTPEDLDPEQVPTYAIARGLAVVRIDDVLHHRGVWSERPVEAVAVREAVDALLQRSIETFPATTLGL